MEDREQKIALLDGEKQKSLENGRVWPYSCMEPFHEVCGERKMPLEVTKRDTRAIQKEMSMVIQEKNFCFGN